MTTKTPTRVYAVQHGTTGTRLVRATSPSVALRHVATNEYQVKVASQNDLIEGVQAGIKVEDAGADAASGSDA